MSSVQTADAIQSPDQNSKQPVTPPPPAKTKTTGGNVAGAFVRTIINPLQLWTAARLQINRKAHRHSFDDAQLALYSKVLPSDFLHFGYFEQTDLKPEDMSLSDVTRARTPMPRKSLNWSARRMNPCWTLAAAWAGCHACSWTGDFSRRP